jgi:hypothetical protein
MAVNFFRFALLTVVLLFANCAEAFHKGSAGFPKSQLNLGFGDLLAQNVTNMFKMGQQFSLSASPSIFDADGMPTANFSGFISYSLPAGPGVDCTVATGVCTISWPAGRAVGEMSLNTPSALNCTSVVNATVTNCSGSGIFTIVPTGGAGSVTFNLTAAGNVVYRWDGTATNYAPGSGQWAFVTQASTALYSAGKWWSSAFETTLLGRLHLEALRTMGWTESGAAQSSNEVKFECRTQTTNFSWVSGQWCPNWQSSSITVAGSSAGQVGQFTATPATETPLTGWVGNEILIGSFPTAPTQISVTGAAPNGGNVQLTVSSSAPLVASQSVFINFVGGTTEANGKHTILTVDSPTLITINVPFVHTYVPPGFNVAFVAYQSLAVTGKSGGTKLIVSNSTGSAPIVAGAGNVFYDSVLDLLLYTAGPITGGPPLEAQAQLANDTNTELWLALPEWAEDNYVTQTANTLSPLLNKNWNPELGNEDWNFQFVAAQWMTQRGTALGIASLTPLPYQGLRIRQIMGNLIPASNYSAALSKVSRLYMFQAFTGAGDTSISGWMAGSSLSPTNNSALCLFLGGTFSGTCSGAPDYSQSPNRPVDVVNDAGFAPYFCGLGLTGQSTDCGSTAPTSFDVPNLQTIGDAFIVGNTSTAISAIDALTRQGRNRVQNITASGTVFTTPLAHNFSIGDWLRCDVVGGTAYSGLNLQVLYQVLSTPLTTTFTMAPWLNGNSTGVAVNAGTAGTGTTNCGYTGNQGSQSIFNVVNNAFVKWQHMIATAFSPAPALGTPGIKWYEGSNESTAPTTQQASTVGLVTPSVPVNITGTTHGTTTVDGISSTSGLYVGMVGSATDITGGQLITAVGTNSVTLSAVASGSNTGESITFSGTNALASSTIASAITAWKNDPAAAASIVAYYKSFMGTDPAWLTFGAMPNAVAPSQLVLCGTSIWAVMPACDPTTTPFQTYFGIQQFNTNWLLRRDIDPSSNDNDPMWLEKAA